jgi:hypothetical protein
MRRSQDDGAMEEHTNTANNPFCVWRQKIMEFLSDDDLEKPADKSTEEPPIELVELNKGIND